MQTSVAVAKLAPIVYKFAKRAIEKDASSYYGLVYGVDYGVFKTDRFKAFDYEDDLFIVEKVDEERSHWWIKAFEPEKKYWNGTSCLPNGGTKTLDALMRASLWHDCGYSKYEAISKATGIPAEKLRAFFDDGFKILSDGYGANKTASNTVYQFLRLGGGVFHKLMKYLTAIILASILLTGCYTVETEMEGPPPEINWTGPFFIGDANE